VRQWRLILCAAAALLGAAAPARPSAESLAAERIRAHVEFLASDQLEGRATGTRGHEIAAAYVASEFRKLGLKPGGENGSWFVRVPLRRATHAAPPALSLTVGGRSVPVTVGKDIAVRPSLTERETALSATLVFVGSGISDPRLRIDDYAGLDVRGKIAVALSDLPASIPSDVAAHLRSIQAATAARHGAVGFIEIGEGRRASMMLERYASRPATDWVDPAGRTSEDSPVRVRLALSPELAARLFERAPVQLAALRAQVRSGQKVRGFPLPATISVRAQSAWSDFTSPEVVAVLPGSDPKLSAEHIILSGHLDHLGIKKDAKPGEDAIYNGALDNAAGVATLIEAAREFVESGKPPRRSIMFIANTGEELGLLGASYLAAHPTVPASSIVGLVNLDMPLLLYDFTDVIAFGAEHSTIARAVAASGAGLGVKASPDPMPGETLFVRSDHYPFVKRGVPAVFLMTGYGNGGKAAWDRFLPNIYHSPKDDLTQPLDWRAGAKFAELNYRIARTLADADQRALWYAGDYFGEAFAPAQPKARRLP
jgi:hypothetical protein